MREASVHLKDIVAAMEAIQGFNVPDTVKKRYPEIPWKEMAGMRDRLIHSYFAQESKPPRYNGKNESHFDSGGIRTNTYKWRT